MDTARTHTVRGGRIPRHGLLAAGLVLAGWIAAAPADAAGGWVPAQGEGYMQAGFSRKTADSWWDGDGHVAARVNEAGESHQHDFRYGYPSGEVGIRDRLAFDFLLTYLWGYEGYQPELERNAGFSDAWLGVSWQALHDAWPLAIRATLRTPFLYDQPGAYERHLYGVEGDSTFFVMNSPEWRGLLRNDLALSVALSHCLGSMPAWISTEIGINLRQGAPADEIALRMEAGHDLPAVFGGQAQAALNGVWSLGNDTPASGADRFRSGHMFNHASMARGTLSVLRPVHEWVVEAGYARWLYGRGARRYQEPFISLSHCL